MNAVYIVLFLALNVIIVHYVHKEGESFYKERVAKNKTTPKIYDIAYKYLPDFTSLKALEILSHIIAFVLPFCFGKEVSIEFLSYLLPIILIRYIFICLTILPKDKNCDNTDFGPINFIVGHCYDKVFSGHFASGILLSLILLSKGYNVAYLGLFNVFNALLILSLRFHYTIDLAVAVLVVLLVYQNKLKLKI